jgi:hypothetical protein
MRGLPAGADYTVCFMASSATGGASDALGYADQCYDNQSPLETPPPVTVRSAATTTGINAALAAAGAVSGTVTDAGLHALAGVRVNVSSPSTHADEDGITGADGSWSVPGLPAGADYEVCFTAAGATGGSSDAFGYVDQCYDNQPTWNTATLVTVTLGATKGGISAALSGAGAMSGVVSDAGGSKHGLADVQVQVSSRHTEDRSAWTAADGTWSMRGLPEGTDYTVCFIASFAVGGTSDPTGYIDQCFENQPPTDPSTPVIVTPGATTTGISAALVGAGGISGFVTDAGEGHLGLGNVVVHVSSANTGVNLYAWTVGDGSWSLSGLPAGTDYTVCFIAPTATGGSSDATGYVSQCFDNQPTSGTPTPVTVASGATRSAINAALVGADGG